MAHPTGTRPFSRFEWMLAARYMRPRRKRSSGLLIAFLSLLGIAIGVMALIIGTLLYPPLHGREINAPVPRAWWNFASAPAPCPRLLIPAEARLQSCLLYS